MKLVGVIVMLLLQIGCAGGAAHVGERNPGRPSSRTTWYKVETFATGDLSKKDVLEVKSSDSGESVSVDTLRMTKQIFNSDGFKTDGKGSVIVEVSHDVKAPGINIGILIPYTHMLTVRVNKGGTALWMARVECPSEYPGRQVTIAQMLTVLRPFIGSSSGGQKSISMKEDDERVIELLSKKSEPEALAK